MVVKALIGLAMLLVFILAATIAVYRYFEVRAKLEHKIRVRREERDSELLSGEVRVDEDIDYELQSEKEDKR